jgi:hypothetical protein
MSSNPTVAAGLPPNTRQKLGIGVVAKIKPVSQLAAEHQVSRKFVYQQGQKAKAALDEVFEPKTSEDEVIYNLPVTKNWLTQLILALVLICHSSYRGVIEILRDLFDTHISIGTIKNRVESAAASASKINQAQDLSTIKVGLHDEIFQGSEPVLAGVDSASTYCYLLQGVEHRDKESWGWHLLDAMAQGFQPDFTIADAGAGLRAGQKEVLPETPCHGDIFHILHQYKKVVNILSRQAASATSKRVKLEQEIAMAKRKCQKTQQLSCQLTIANKQEQKRLALAADVKTTFGWMSHDIFKLAGSRLSVRQELYDFIVIELAQREEHPQILKLRNSLQNQRQELLAFAGVLDQKLEEISTSFDVPLQKVRDVCLLHRKQPTSNAYWECWNQLHSQLSGKFYLLMKAVTMAMKETPRASSLVENLNSRLRNYFFLRKTLGKSYLNLLQFFLNHHRFMRSDVFERVNKSPKELMTGKSHSHWLELMGFQRFQRA